MQDPIAEIAVGISVDKTFHYRIPEELSSMLVPGSRVLVPFGSRRIAGTVLGSPEAAGRQGLKTIIEVIDDPLPPALLTLARWMADFYLHPLGQVIEAIIPKALGRAKPKRQRFLRLIAPHHLSSLRGKKQIELVQLLTDKGETPFDRLGSFSSQTIKTLCDLGIIECVERDAPPLHAEPFTPESAPVLMPEQAEAVRRIAEQVRADTFNAFLLHGVTGSGKTEVYLRTIAALPGSNKGAIVLVPEIALTPQLLGRFRRRFGRRVAVLHSGLTDRERADEYRRIRSGAVDVAIGARSAVFAPFPRLGLVIVDEEHESSYKQEEGLRYHGRDVAVMRAKQENAVAILGSATPSLESFWNAKGGRYGYLRLAHRVDHRPLPQVTIIDSRTLPKHAVYSPRLLEDVGLRLERGEQTLLLLNRRGFSSVLICRDCGVAIRCPSCSVSLTFHKADRTLKCHYCGHLVPPPDTCPSCAGADLKLLGAGTQRIEEELQPLFPQARIERMDSDSIRGRDAYERLLDRVDQRAVDILLGTQMVAKGHDFPGVTLVGVVDADVGLNLPDFRAAEKTFQLITQAAGRAGRGELGGEVIIQTMNPNHYAIRHSRTHDYEGFYDEEIGYRTQLGYPPAGRLIKIEVAAADEGIAAEAAKVARNRIRHLQRGKDTTLLGPAPAPLARLRGKYRFQLLLLSQRREEIRRLAIEGRNAVEERFARKCRVIVDVDPVHLL